MFANILQPPPLVRREHWKRRGRGERKREKSREETHLHFLHGAVVDKVGPAPLKVAPEVHELAVHLEQRQVVA